MSKFKVSNPFLKEEFSDYLLANGYFRSEFSTESFFKGDLAVIFRNDHVDIMVLNEEEPGERKAGLSKYMSFCGISQLDTFEFMLLMHITGVVKLKHFISAVKKEGEQRPKIPEDVFKFFGYMFDNGKQIPECY